MSLDAILTTPKSRCLFKPYPGIVCQDGTFLSVQVGEVVYCSPRNDVGPWHEVEVGFPSVQPPDTWEPYCQDWENPTKTVYGWVPVELVRQFIADHGGEV